jgi:hypothetical protein
VDIDGTGVAADFAEAIVLTRATGLDVQTMVETGQLYLGGAFAAGNSDPVLTAPSTVNVLEATTFVLTAEATDVDGQPLSFSISGGADAAFFQIDASSGELSFVQPPDFEAPFDAGSDNVYDVSIDVEDGLGGRDTAAIAVSVVDLGTIAPAYSTYNEVAAIGFTEGTAGSDVFVFGPACPARPRSPRSTRPAARTGPPPEMRGRPSPSCAT